MNTYKGKPLTILRPDQFVRVPAYQQYTLFYVFCTEEYAIRYGESAEKALQKSIENPQDIAALSQSAACLSASAAMREKQQREWDSAVVLTLGSFVQIAGRKYEVEAAANGNLWLRPIPERGVKFYGHPKTNRYPARVKVA